MIIRRITLSYDEYREIVQAEMAAYDAQIEAENARPATPLVALPPPRKSMWTRIKGVFRWR